jgi:malic enzyme
MEDDFLEQTRGREIDLIVCTDSEAILGIGDQGVGVSPFFSPLTKSKFDRWFM